MLLNDQFQKEVLVQNRKLYIKIENHPLHANSNIEYAIKLASQLTFEFSNFDQSLDQYFSIADKVI